MDRKFGVIVLAVVFLLLASGCLDKLYPYISPEDTVKYKLKYVRLRPIHEENRLRIQSRMTQQEYESMKIAVHGVLAVVDPE